MPAWNANPPDDAGWRALVAKLADAAVPVLAKARDQLGVTMEATTIGGVKAFVFTPRTMPEAHRDQLIFNIHGGGYVYGPGESGTAEAMLMSALGGYKVIAVDYRMPPDAPYPAAMDDAAAAWRAVAASTDPKRIGIVGTSTGGGMILALMLRAKAEGLPLPAAIAPRHALVRHDRDRGHLQDQRVAGQRPGQLRRLPEPCRQAVRRRARPARPGSYRRSTATSPACPRRS